MGWRRRYNLLYIGSVWTTICHTICFRDVVIRLVCFIYHMYTCQYIRLLLWLLCISMYVWKHLYIVVAIYMYTIRLIVNWSFHVLKSIYSCFTNRNKEWGDVLASHHICACVILHLRKVSRLYIILVSMCMSKSYHRLCISLVSECRSKYLWCVDWE